MNLHQTLDPAAAFKGYSGWVVSGVGSSVKPAASPHPHPMLDHDVFDGFNCSHFPLGMVEPGGQTHRLIQREGGLRPAYCHVWSNRDWSQPSAVKDQILHGSGRSVKSLESR